MGMPPARQHSRTNLLSCGNRPLPCSWMKAVSNIPGCLGCDHLADEVLAGSRAQHPGVRAPYYMHGGPLHFFAQCNARSRGPTTTWSTLPTGGGEGKPRFCKGFSPCQK